MENQLLESCRPLPIYSANDVSNLSIPQNNDKRDVLSTTAFKACRKS